MKLLKNIIIDPRITAVQDAMWLRPQQNGGISVYIPHGLEWRKIAQFGESDTEDDDEFNFKEIYEGVEPPDNYKKVWFDPESITEAELESQYPDFLQMIINLVNELKAKTDILYKLYTIGAIAGDSTSSARTQMTEASDLIPPETDEELPEDDGTKPDVSDIEYTVPALVPKLDTASNLSKNRQNLIDGDLLFYTDLHKLVVYYEGKFYGASSSGGGGGSDPSGGGITIDDLYNLILDYLNFTDGDDSYKVTVDKNGKVVARKYSDDVTRPGSKVTNDVYVNHLLCINSVYCGGNGGENCLVSHNLVELANGSDIDINLKGLFLLYTDGTQRDPNDVGFIWHVLPLSGIIKAGGSFLIRGAQCHNMKSAFIPVENYDMEWKENNQLMAFNQGCASFYLCVGDINENWVYDSNGELMDKYSLRSPWSNSTTNVGYIDSCGFGVNSVGEGTSAFLIGDDWDKCLMVRWFMFEPAKQGNKAYSSRKTTDLWTYINLEKQTERLDNSEQYYYPDWMKQAFAPKASQDDKNFFTNKTLFRKDKPNMVNITFGIQATSIAADEVLASRCFNWVSVGYYDEYLEYRKKGTSAWTRVYSITDNDASNPQYISQFIQFYRRYRWCTASGVWVTTHKVVLKNVFDAGQWEYRVGRHGDDAYTSEIFNFTVIDNADIAAGFKFIQTTDQQGFNWAEYQAWKKTAKCIKDTEEPLFTINTGDITQSGNRENEWLDYYDGRQFLRELEEMFTIGNNDLCGHDATKLTDGNDATSKYNHINVLRYYTFELDPENNYFFTWNGEQYPLYSLYSFNFGLWHFVCLNSETAIASSKTYVGYESDTNPGDASYARAANAAIETWLRKDLQIFKGLSGATVPSGCSDVIVYMHEMPFTMVTWDFMGGSTGRVGSHLNTLDNNGNYRFSRLFKKYGIRLVIGGHKHTYTISKPIYDAPEGYIGNNNKPVDGVDLMGEVTTALSRTPVIQVLRDEDVIAGMAPYARYEVVDHITAPVYVMSQASGYKLVSNKEQPSGDQYTIPWLMAYFKPKTNASSPTENRRQHYPMYVLYEVKPGSIKITAKQVHGVWDINEVANTAKYDMNNQLTHVEALPMTLHEASAADIEAYGIVDTDSYTIDL